VAIRVVLGKQGANHSALTVDVGVILRAARIPWPLGTDLAIKQAVVLDAAQHVAAVAVLEVLESVAPRHRAQHDESFPIFGPAGRKADAVVYKLRRTHLDSKIKFRHRAPVERSGQSVERQLALFDQVQRVW